MKFSSHVGKSDYKPRDVVNAPDIKKSVLLRSEKRGDSQEIQSWLLNHFFRHLIANFSPPIPALQEVSSLEHAQRLFAPRSPPSWLQARFKSLQDSLWWLDPDSSPLLALEGRLVEFLGSRKGTSLEGKLMRINCPQALALAASEHAAIESDQQRGWREHQPAAVRSAQGDFVEFVYDSALLRSEMAFESQMMRHCLGQFGDRKALTGGYGEHYASACEAGKMRLFSLRSAQHQPRITVSVLVNEDGSLSVDQIKGKQNMPPVEKYQSAVLNLLNELNTNQKTPPDAAHMGLVRLGKGWCKLSEVTDDADQLSVVHRHPAAIRKLLRPGAAAQWLVAARDPGLLEGLELSAALSSVLASRAGAQTS